jgi:glycine/D-amino acid oxidase-like deaminating enzyme
VTLDLRTGSPIWSAYGPPQSTHAKLNKDISCDVVVIGAGISGALISNLLANRGRRVTIVDSRDVARGSTAASTAMLSYEADVNLGELIAIHGKRDAVRAYEAGIEAISEIEAVIHTLDDSCDFRRRRSLYLASSRNDLQLLKTEFRTRQKHGFKVEFLGRHDIKRIFDLDARGAILNEIAAEVNPLRLTLALVRHAQSKGAKIFAHTKIASYQRSRKQCILTTEDQFRITTKHVVFATGYETQLFLKQKAVRLVSSYAIATTPIRHFPPGFEHPVIWESARPYFYVRTTNDNRLVAGGEDVDFQDDIRRDKLLSAKAKTLERKLRRMFPRLEWKRIAAWTGTFGESEDGLPYIGHHRDFPGALFALGYGGNGITFSAIASRIVADLICGKHNPDAAIFRFGRKT